MSIAGWTSHQTLQYLSPPTSVSRWAANQSLTSLTTTYSTGHKVSHQRLYSTKITARISVNSAQNQASTPSPEPKASVIKLKVPKNAPFVSASRSWGLFGDIHFDDRALDRVNQTADWIVETFKERGVSQIICMGDVLNTREVVSVQALSSAVRFFDKLSDIANVHIILGNHDMNLKHSGKLSSLDSLDMRDLRHRITLYRNITATEIDGIPCIMLPYQENNTNILNWIKNFSTSSNPHPPLSDHVVFAHLSLEGAVQRFHKDNQKTHIRTYQTLDVSPTASKITPKVMSPFKRSFSGHFHHHHSPAPGFTYVGAPMQHTYGDAGDDARGVVLYDPKKNNFEFVQNPKWDVFRTMRVETEDDLVKAKKEARKLEGKFITLVYSGQMSMKSDQVDEMQNYLLKAGALEARKTSVLPSRSVPTPLPGHSTEEAIGPYVNLCLTALGLQADKALAETLVSSGRDVIQKAQEKGTARVTTQGNTFAAQLKSVTMENFLGVRGQTTIDMYKMRDGVWFLTGPNGSGKSTILEAVTWCLFDRFLRSDMKSDFAVNDTAKRDCCVRLDFDNGYSIERFRKFREKGGIGLRISKDGQYISEMERGGVKDSQKVLEALLGVTFETFTKSVVLGDNSAMNFLLSDSKRRRETIEELLEMGNFDSYLIESREQRKALDQALTKLANREIVINDSLTMHATEVAKLKESLQSVDKANKVASDELKEVLLRLDEWAKNDAELRKLDAQKQAKISDRTLLDKWEIYQSRLREQTSFSTSLNSLKSQLNNVKNTQKDLKDLKSKEESIRDLQEKISQIRSADIVQLQTQKVRVEGQQSDLVEETNKMQQLLKEGKCPTCQQSVTKDVIKSPNSVLKDRRVALDKELATIRKKQEKLETELAALEKNLTTKLSGLTSEDYFRKLVEVSFVDNDAARLEKEIAQIEVQITQIGEPKECLKEFKQPVSQLESKVNKLRQSTSNDENTHTDSVADQISRHQDLKMRLTEEQYRFKADLDRLATQKEDYVNRHNDLADTMGELTGELEDIKIEKKTVTDKLRVWEFWEKGFDKKTTSKSEFPTLRSYLIAQSVEDLNLILSEYNTIIGTATNMRISFNSELELNEDFGKRSAGQRKRNDIAIMLALFELVRQRGRFRADFIMLDEVFDALDVSGQQSVQGLLTMLSERVSKVLVITHSQPHLMGKDANVLKVAMTPEGTKFEVSGQVAY